MILQVVTIIGGVIFAWIVREHFHHFHTMHRTANATLKELKGIVSNAQYVHQQAKRRAVAKGLYETFDLDTAASLFSAACKTGVI